MDKKTIQSNKWYKKLLELLQEDYIHINEFSRPGAAIGSHAAMVWHYTANPGAGDENHKTYFDNLRLQDPQDAKEDRYASAHIFIDKDSGRIIVPLWEVAYHAGNGWYNKNSLSCELCMEKDGSFHPATIARAVKVGALLQLIFGWKTDRNIRHYDVTKKLCPLPWVKKPALYTKFKQDVEAQIKLYTAEESTFKPVDNVGKCSIEVNGKIMAVSGIIRDGHSFLPVRSVAEAAGASVSWCETTKQIKVNDKDITEEIVSGTGYAPARELGTVLGLSVDWCAKTKTVILKGCV